ncbi:MAG: DNA methylase [Chloroflexi bacterium]|nr:DNA methylase [Chloroflexota bacterium]
MTSVTVKEYEEFISSCPSVEIEGKTIKLRGPQHPRTLQPEAFTTETTTLWSFPQRGKWATHRARYRGNWAPQIARNIILRYSQPGDTVLDQMVGGGTSMVECKLTGRNGIGVDINRDALMLTLDSLSFSGTVLEPLPQAETSVYQGDARNLNLVADESIDLIATHPPYADIIRYTTPANGSTEGDLSKVRNIAAFVEQMGIVAQESYRVLKPDHYCAILVGDTRRSKHYTPIAFRVMQAFLDTGFILKEDIIKAQWNTQTEGLWGRMSRDKNFLLIMHEHLFVFRKPAAGERVRPYAESMSWW